MEQELTFGQKLVGIRFNHAEGQVKNDVDKAKQLFADIADMIGDPYLRSVEQKSESTLKLLIKQAAITQIMLAQMAVVKYLTW